MDSLFPIDLASFITSSEENHPESTPDVPFSSSDNPSAMSEPETFADYEYSYGAVRGFCIIA